MKVSVAIPTYNSARFIQATLNSVLTQSVAPNEILVVDDGSTDETVAILSSFGSSIRLIRQSNQGVAAARNVLARNVSGDLVTFLDHDDLWHPRYLETQCTGFRQYPEAVAFFAGHVNFGGYEGFQWPERLPNIQQAVEVIEPLKFLLRYNTATANFGSMSFIAVPRRVLVEMGDEPFRISGVDDSYFCTQLPLLGSVVYQHEALVAYRVTDAAQSANWLRSTELWLKVFELLRERYSQANNARLFQTFRTAHATKRRRYARLLMGAGKTSEGRRQFWCAIRESREAFSYVKSIAWLLASYLPHLIQPEWPNSNRMTTPET